MAKLNKQKTRRMSIRTKILLPVLIIILVVSAGLGTMMYLVGETAYIEAGVEKSHMAANIATSMIDGVAIKEIHEGNADDYAYERQLENLREIKDDCDILYMYTIYERDGELFYGIDTDTSEGQCQLGDSYDDDPEPVRVALDGKDFVALFPFALDDFLMNYRIYSVFLLGRCRFCLN